MLYYKIECEEGSDPVDGKTLMKRSGGRVMEQPGMGLSIRVSVETQAENHRHEVIGVRDTEPKEFGLVVRFKPLLISR